MVTTWAGAAIDRPAWRGLGVAARAAQTRPAATTETGHGRPTAATEAGRHHRDRPRVAVRHTRPAC
jgi:hypothetical protein